MEKYRIAEHTNSWNITTCWWVEVLIHPPYTGWQRCSRRFFTPWGAQRYLRHLEALRTAEHIWHGEHDFEEWWLNQNNPDEPDNTPDGRYMGR